MTQAFEISPPMPVAVASSHAETLKILLIEDNYGDARLVEILLEESDLHPSFHPILY